MTVYFIRAGADGPVKIGFSVSNLDARIKALQTASPAPLSVLRVIEDAGKATEAWLHQHFAAHRTQGEWFEFCDSMLNVDPPEEASKVDTSRRARRIADAEERQFSHAIRLHTAEFDSPEERVTERYLRHRAVSAAIACAAQATKYTEDAEAYVAARDADAAEAAIHRADEFRALARRWLERSRTDESPPALEPDRARR